MGAIEDVFLKAKRVFLIITGYFLTPVYSSTVFEEIVVVTLLESPTCV